MQPTPETELIPQQYQDSFKEYTHLETKARELSLAIKDDPSYRAAAEFRKTIETQRKNWALVIKPAVQAAHLAHKKVKDVENMVDRPLNSALEILDPQISRWRVEQENQRRIEQEKINRKLRQDEEDRRIAEAEELEKSGKKEEAEAILEAPIQAPEVVLPSTTRVDGIADRTYWSADVFDIVKLCRAVADGKAPLTAVMPNMTLLGGMARSMKASMNAQWEPWGVKAVSRNDISGGR